AALDAERQHDVRVRDGQAAVVHRAVEVVVGGVQTEDRQLAETDGRAAVVHEAVAVVVDRVRALAARLLDARDAAGARLRDLHVVPRLDRLADAVPEIAHRARSRRAAAGLAELQHELVDVVAARRRRGPGVRRAAAELHVEVGARERDAPRVDAGPVYVLLDEQLRHEIAGLRAEDGDRRAG